MSLSSKCVENVKKNAQWLTDSCVLLNYCTDGNEPSQDNIVFERLNEKMTYMMPHTPMCCMPCHPWHDAKSCSFIECGDHSSV